MKIAQTLIAMFACVVLSACGGRVDEAELDGPVILTIAEAPQPSPNPPAYEGLFATYEIPVADARVFSRRDLSALRWRQITTDFPAGSPRRSFEGPRLSDVLQAAGFARGTSVRLTAFDGYEAEIDAAMIARHDPILALRADGAPLPTGGLGPVMLVWPRGDRGALSDMSDDLWAWGVFAIRPVEAEAEAG